MWVDVPRCHCLDRFWVDSHAVDKTFVSCHRKVEDIKVFSGKRNLLHRAIFTVSLMLYRCWVSDPCVQPFAGEGSSFLQKRSLTKYNGILLRSHVTCGCKF